MEKFYFIRNTSGLKQIDKPSSYILNKFKSDQMEMTIFNISEGGESIVVKNNQRAIMVDCGGGHGSMTINENLGKHIRKYLIDKNIVLNTLIASHNHHDHTNAFASLLAEDTEQFLADDIQYIHNGEKITKGINNTLFPKLRNELEIPIDDDIEIGKPERLQWRDDQDIIMVKSNRTPKAYRSILLNIPFKNANYLLTGDLQESHENYLLKDDLTSPYLEADVLKITHHGSSSGTNTPFLYRSSPGLFMSSSASDEGHKLESDVIERISDYAKIKGFEVKEENRFIFDTAEEDGDITVRTDGVWRELNDDYGILFEVEVNSPGIHPTEKH